MVNDLTAIDSFGWDALKRALNQRVVINGYRLVPSKRNRVWIVETNVRPVVVKQFLSGKCGREFETLLLARSAGLNVPYPLFKDGDYLVTAYVPGETCEVLINQMFSADAASGMGSWLAKFHASMGARGHERIMGDSVLANFVFSEGEVYGVDLEDSTPGNPLEDLGKLSASILGSEPFFTPIKFDICLRLIRAYEDAAHVKALEEVRPFVSKHLRMDAKSKPLFRRTLIAAASSLELGWPKLA